MRTRGSQWAIAPDHRDPPNSPFREASGEVSPLFVLTWRCHLTIVLADRDSLINIFQLAADATSETAESLGPYRQSRRTSSGDFDHGSAIGAERGN
jgi:hypothetical protein